MSQQSDSTLVETIAEPVALNGSAGSDNQLADNTADKVGIWTSSLCALHCLLIPVLVPLLPAVGGSFFAQTWFERTILSLSMLIGFWALLTGYNRYHRRIYPLYILSLGGLIYWQKDILGEAWEPLTITVGAGLIITSHIINIRLCRRCKRC